MTVDCVIDNSALIESVAVAKPDVRLIRRMLASSACAPEIIDAEALRVLRSMNLRQELSSAQAERALTRVSEAPIARVPLKPLVARAWNLRHSVSAYDALYIALAEVFDVPLLTCDAKLARSNGHNAKIELFPNG
ncbi:MULTISPECIES: type II toxin-antitoxin system VapC family toxin [Actinoalloteichus]|uniref:Ribonuclease VapC n=1 Tax=Actinoalloteichus fjordicus TaxID=1612552 RepID=A0AAC9LC98_9PSEU|nr:MULTISPECIES: type II toxin-antitoxin system VapC family toxin [Actinoalloteichus]APU14220.1 putative nucleic acid-binding protein, contains PIN domain [Actinoalloteichus fjordicus]APU20189.1 putative nucleic acid-binding protein, contains PIN domain [Actinoalloteichus sp. GBA129-24]